MIDDTDTLILLALMEFENCTSTRLAKEIFDFEEREDIKRADSIVRARLKKLEEKKYIVMTGDNPRTYSINDTVTKGYGVILLANGQGGWVELELGQLPVIAIRNHNKVLIRLFEGIEPLVSKSRMS